MDNYIRIRLTNEEKVKFKAMAKGHGLTMSSLIRRWMREAEEKPAEESEEKSKWAPNGFAGEVVYK